MRKTAIKNKNENKQANSSHFKYSNKDWTVLHLTSKPCIWFQSLKRLNKPKNKNAGCYYLNILSYRIHHGWRLHVCLSIWTTPNTLKLWWRRRIKNQRTWLHMISTFKRNKRKTYIKFSENLNSFIKNNFWFYSHKFCFLMARPSFSFLPWKFICD